MNKLLIFLLSLLAVSLDAATITNWGSQLPTAAPVGSDVILMQKGGVTYYFTPNQLAANIATNANNVPTNSIGGIQVGHLAGSLGDNTNGVNIGYQAGYGVTNSWESNFDGYQAGYEADNVYRSHFDGYLAGYEAYNAYYAHFDGHQAGYQVTNAYYAHFDGFAAGYQATNVYGSHFDGYQAGFGATNCWNSHFDGESAGFKANNSYGSHFDGYLAGYHSKNNYYSHFDGYQAGDESENAYHTHLDGNRAGYQATNIYGSHFDGWSAGFVASNAYYSHFDGHGAGYEAYNAYGSHFDGYQAGFKATNTYYSHFDGYQAGLGANGAHHSIFFGSNTGTNATRPYTWMVGMDQSSPATNTLLYAEFDNRMVRVNGSLQVTNGALLATVQGNVGIGTMATVNKLDVVGSVSIGAAIANQYSTLLGINSPNNATMSLKDTSSSAYIITGIEDGAGSFIVGSSANDAIFLHSGGNMNFSVDNGASIAMRVSTVGNVGINTTTPLGKLHVVGGIVQTNGGIWQTWSLGAPSAPATQGAVYWNDGTNICAVFMNAAGALSTNKLSMTAWP